MQKMKCRQLYPTIGQSFSIYFQIQYQDCSRSQIFQRRGVVINSYCYADSNIENSSISMFYYFKMPILTLCILLLLLLAPVCSQSISLVSAQNITSGDDANFEKVATVDFTDDGSLLLIAIDDELQIWSVNSSNQYTQVSNISASDGLEDVYFNANYSIIAGTGRSSTFIYYWDSASNYNYLPAQLLDNGSPPLSLSWNSNGNFTIVGSQDSGIRVYNFTNGLWGQMQNLTGHTGPVIALRARNSRVASVALGDTNLIIWYYNTTMGIYYPVETETILQVNATALDYSADEKWIAVGHNSGPIQIFQRNSTYNYTKIQTLDMTVNGHTNSIINLRFSLDGSMLISTSADNTTKLWTWNWTSGNWSVGSGNTYSIPGYSVDFNQLYQVAVGWANSSYGNVSLLDVQATKCAADPNSNGTATPDGTECYCNTGFHWRYQSCYYLNCAKMNNSSGNQSSVSSCVCNQGYLWDPYQLMCIINCAFVPNSLGLNYQFSSCLCQSGFNWNGSNCTAYVNCSGITNGNGSNIDSNNCFCNYGYYFNATATSCYVDCTYVNNSNGYDPSNTSACQCNGGYFWNDSFLQNSSQNAACQRDCSALNFTNGNDNDNADYCSCEDSFDWNSSVSQCIVNCSRVKFSTGVKFRDRERCHCQDEYWWDRKTQQCLPHTGSVKGAAIACGIAIPLSILLLLIAYKLYRYYRRHKTRKPPKVIPIYVQPVLNMSQNRIIAPPHPQPSLGQLVSNGSSIRPQVVRSSTVVTTTPIVGVPPAINGPMMMSPAVVGPPTIIGPNIPSPRPMFGSNINRGQILNSTVSRPTVGSPLLPPPPVGYVGGPPIYTNQNGFNPPPPPRYTGLPINGGPPPNLNGFYNNGPQRFNGQQPPIYRGADRRTRQENAVSSSLVKIDPYRESNPEQ